MHYNLVPFLWNQQVTAGPLRLEPINLMEQSPSSENATCSADQENSERRNVLNDWNQL